MFQLTTLERGYQLFDPRGELWTRYYTGTLTGLLGVFNPTRWSSNVMTGRVIEPVGTAHVDHEGQLISKASLSLRMPLLGFHWP